jgi:UDP:flavonoid glycosyltransferase YjiC (YdhE family)
MIGTNTGGCSLATLIFFNLPEVGHMNPTLPVVAELVQRGHQVIYYSGEAMRSAIEDTGATFHSYGQAFRDEPLPAYDNQFLHLLFSLQIRQQVLAHLIPEIRALAPDAIVYDKSSQEV